MEKKDEMNKSGENNIEKTEFSSSTETNINVERTNYQFRSYQNRSFQYNNYQNNRAYQSNYQQNNEQNNDSLQGNYQQNNRFRNFNNQNNYYQNNVYKQNNFQQVRNNFDKNVNATTSSEQDSQPRSFNPVNNEQKPKWRKKKKVCSFCIDRNLKIEYKDVSRLRRFMSERAKILPRRVTGMCACHQKMLTIVIKHARFLALIPYFTD